MSKSISLSQMIAKPHGFGHHSLQIFGGWVTGIRVLAKAPQGATPISHRPHHL